MDVRALMLASRPHGWGPVCWGIAHRIDIDLPLGDDPHTLRSARAALDAALVGAGWPREAVQAACLVVTELAANAISHGGGIVDARCVLGAGGLRFSVADASTALPQMLEPSAAELSGRGLRLIDALSDRWGFEVMNASAAQKEVWAEIRPD